MLSTMRDSSAEEVRADVTERLSIGRLKKSGEWAELQAAAPSDSPDRTTFEHWRADSLYLSIDAITLLHDAFARSLPGFDLFLPKLYEPSRLPLLRKELTTLRSQLSNMLAVSAAKVRWGSSSSLIQQLPDDAAWLRARAALVATLDELVTLVEALEKQNQGLWVLGI